MDMKLVAAFLGRPEVRNLIKQALESQFQITQRKLRNEVPGSDVHAIRRRECQELRSIATEFEGFCS